MKLSARLDCRRVRTSRSPRISCSVISAVSAVSKPDSRPSTASATWGRGKLSACGHDATGARLRSPCWRAHAPCARASLRSTARSRRACRRLVANACACPPPRTHWRRGLPVLSKIVAGMRADFDEPLPSPSPACGREGGGWSRHSSITPTNKAASCSAFSPSMRIRMTEGVVARESARYLWKSASRVTMVWPPRRA